MPSRKRRRSSMQQATDTPDIGADPTPIAGSRGESAAHRELKRLALVWAQARGFRIASAEVSLPTHRYRLDVAACRVERQGRTNSSGSALPPLTMAIFE